jgi:hypothetical protein
MPLFGPPSIEKLKQKRDVSGLAGAKATLPGPPRVRSRRRSGGGATPLSPASTHLP